MNFKTNRINQEMIDEQPLSVLDDWSQTQSDSLLRRTIDALLAVLAFFLFLLYPAVFMLL